jgi:hypothetical protein
VGTHVTLKVEVGELIILLKLEKLAELSISKNTTSVLGVLKLMSTDVRVNLTSHLGACHLSSLGLSKETSELKANLSGLYKTAGSAVTRLTLLATLLGSLLKLTVGALGKSTNLSSYSGKLRTKRGELGEKSSELVSKSRSSWGCRSCLLNWGNGGSGCGYLSGFLRLRLRYFFGHLMNYYNSSFLSPFTTILIFIAGSMLLHYIFYY